MPRKILIRNSEYPYHITNRSNNREFFYISQEQLWEIFIFCLAELEKQFECEIHAFVLMTNHYHLIISTPEANIGQAMKYLHREVARKANKRSGRINHFFGGRYKWSVINSENYYWNSIKYVFRNPVKAGLCASVKDYKFSSLNSSPVQFNWKMIDFFSENKHKIQLDWDWLDQSFAEDQELLIQKALRRREFSLPIGKNKKKVELAPAHWRKDL